jgi:hypothetical protein
LISQVPVPPLDGAVLSLLDPSAPRADLVAALRWLAESPAPPLAESPAHRVRPGRQS